MVFLVSVLIVVSLSFPRLKGFGALEFVLVRILIKENFLLFFGGEASLSLSLSPADDF